MQVSKICALAVALTLMGAPMSVYAANGNGDSGAAGGGGEGASGGKSTSSPECSTKGQQMMAGQNCPESKTAAPTSTGN